MERKAILRAFLLAVALDDDDDDDEVLPPFPLVQVAAGAGTAGLAAAASHFGLTMTQPTIPGKGKNPALEAQFKKFATKGDEATTKDISRWMTDAGVFTGARLCTSQNCDIAFSAVKTKGRNTITVKQVYALITSISVQFGKDHKMSKEEAEETIIHMLSASEKQGHGTTGISKTGGVDRMTDHAAYTGMHKERFDEEGKGKGIDGREYRSDNTGYVGQYKGQGTYEAHNQ